MDQWVKVIAAETNGDLSVTVEGDRGQVTHVLGHLCSCAHVPSQNRHVSVIKHIKNKEKTPCKAYESRVTCIKTLDFYLKNRNINTLIISWP